MKTFNTNDERIYEDYEDYEKEIVKEQKKAKENKTRTKG